MKDDIRFAEMPTESEIQQPDSYFSTLAEEVRARSQKPHNDPIAIPQKLALGEFNTAMVHFYRGEIQRSNVWRSRLDATTNWAVITAGATLSFVFSSPDNPHFAIPINSLLVSIFLFMEARRYRYYEVWASRVRVLETGYFATMLSHRAIAPDEEWADHLSADLIKPHFNISEMEAVGRRLRSNYVWIFLLLAVSWSLKVYIHPFPAPNIETFVHRAQIGFVPGWLVIAAGLIFNSLILFVAIFTLRYRNASSEVMPLDKIQWHPLKQVSEWADANLKRRNTLRRARRARQRIRSAQTEVSKEIHETLN